MPSVLGPWPGSREDRYPTAAELGQDVECWLNGEPVSVYPESFLKRWGRRLRGH